MLFPTVFPACRPVSRVTSFPASQHRSGQEVWLAVWPWRRHLCCSTHSHFQLCQLCQFCTFSQSVRWLFFFNVAYSYWCRLKPFSNICPLICHHPTALPCICFYLHILFFSCVWLQHIRLIQMPTLPTLMHLETLQFHPIWTHLPPQSPCHQVPSILPLPVFHFTHTVVLFSQICLAV